MVELQLLGGVSLRSDDGPVTGLAARRHPLALLALLATAPQQALSRAKAVGLLWPDVDETTGRNRLSSTVYPLRKLLGAAALNATGDTLGLAPSSLACDVWRFEEALHAGDWAAALHHYRGPFMDGFYLEAAPLFEERLFEERERLERAWRGAVEALAGDAERDGRHRDSAKAWQRLFAHDPLDSATAGRLVQALAAAGSYSEARRTADLHAARLSEELGVTPDEDFLRIVDALRRQQPGGAAAETPSIAVLLFDAPRAGESPAVAEGVHGGILNRLTALEGLTVIARSSVRRFRDSDLGASQLGAQLGVRWVLEGSVQTHGDQFRVDVRLVEARRDRQVWAQEFVATLDAENYFGVLADIAAQICDQLSYRLTLQQRAGLQLRATENLEVHRLAAMGRLYLDHRSPEDMQRALGCFEQAVALDPGHALSWVGLADTLGLMHAYGFADDGVLPRAREAIATALAKDPACAEAHAAHGRMLGQERRQPEARRALLRAIELRPGYAEAHNWITIGHQIEGEIGRALDSAHRAVTLNPLSPEAVINLCSSLMFAGRHVEAEREAARALQLEPGYGTADFYQAVMHYENKRFLEALRRLEGLALPWLGSGVETLRALCHTALGEHERAESLLQAIRKSGHAFNEGLVLAALGREDEAMAALERFSPDGEMTMAVGYWPAVTARYLFRRAWDSLDAGRLRERLLRRMERSWGM